MQTMRASANLIELLKQYEGFKPDAELCVSGKKHPDGSPMYDIGYGCQYWEDGERVQLGDSISRPEAEALKRSRIAIEFEPDILEYMGDITFGPNMWDALVSAWYNLRAPRTQPIMKAIRDGEYGQHVEMIRPLAERWMLYSDRKNPDIRKGLWRRRGAEVLMANGLPDPFENSQTLDFEQPIWPMVERLRSEQGWVIDYDLVESAPTPPSPKPEPVVISEPIPEPALPDPEPKKPRKVSEPFENYDPSGPEKPMPLSKRFHGYWLIFVGWTSGFFEMLTHHPFTQQLAAMSPIKAPSPYVAAGIIIAGFLLLRYGQVKAKGPTK